MQFSELKTTEHSGVGYWCDECEEFQDKPVVTIWTYDGGTTYLCKKHVEELLGLFPKEQG